MQPVTVRILITPSKLAKVDLPLADQLFTFEKDYKPSEISFEDDTLIIPLCGNKLKIPHYGYIQKDQPQAKMYTLENRLDGKKTITLSFFNENFHTMNPGIAVALISTFPLLLSDPTWKQSLNTPTAT